MPPFTLSCLVAYAHHRVIGYQNTLPWHLPADLKRFRSLTMGKPIIMGRKTHLSIGKALPGRINIILSSDLNFQAEGCVVFSDLSQAILYARSQSDEAFIIGGSSIYEQALPFIHTLHLTEIHHTFQGDAFFPELSPDDWTECGQESHEPDEQNPYRYTYHTLIQKHPKRIDL